MVILWFRSVKRGEVNNCCVGGSGNTGDGEENQWEDRAEEPCKRALSPIPLFVLEGQEELLYGKQKCAWREESA